MRAAMERREAPGLFAGARAPRDPHRPPKHLGPGSSACRPADRKAGLREPIARLPGRLPALRPAPMERGGKQGDGPSRGPKKHRAGTAERWLKGARAKMPPKTTVLF